MPDALATYIHDHLAGAQFAVSLLDDLQKLAVDKRVADLADQLLPEIEADRRELQQFADRLGDASNAPKEAAAWAAQKASRIKLAPDDDLGAFEALEMLCLGIQGKLSLWSALKALNGRDDRINALDLDELATRAADQHSRTEALRLELAPRALAGRQADGVE